MMTYFTDEYVSLSFSDVILYEILMHNLSIILILIHWNTEMHNQMYYQLITK